MNKVWLCLCFSLLLSSHAVEEARTVWSQFSKNIVEGQKDRALGLCQNGFLAFLKKDYQNFSVSLKAKTNFYHSGHKDAGALLVNIEYENKNMTILADSQTGKWLLSDIVPGHYQKRDKLLHRKKNLMAYLEEGAIHHSIYKSLKSMAETCIPYLAKDLKKAIPLYDKLPLEGVTVKWLHGEQTVSLLIASGSNFNASSESIWAVSSTALAGVHYALYENAEIKEIDSKAFGQLTKLKRFHKCYLSDDVVKEVYALMKIIELKGFRERVKSRKRLMELGPLISKCLLKFTTHENIEVRQNSLEIIESFKNIDKGTNSSGKKRLNDQWQAN